MENLGFEGKLSILNELFKTMKWVNLNPKTFPWLQLIYCGRPWMIFRTYKFASMAAEQEETHGICRGTCEGVGSV